MAINATTASDRALHFNYRPTVYLVVIQSPEDPEMRSILLLLLGVPLPIIILIALFSH